VASGFRYFGLDPQEEVTAWVAFTQSSRENGCVRVMPRSHLAADYAHDETHQPDNLLIRGQTIRGLDDTEAVDLELRPGEFSLHQERTVHGSLPNQSAVRRIGYAMFFIPTHVRSTLGRRSALLVRGHDTYGHWDADPTARFDDDPLIDEFIAQTFQRYRDRNSA